MNTSEVEKFFAVCPEDDLKKGDALLVRAENTPAVLHGVYAHRSSVKTFQSCVFFPGLVSQMEGMDLDMLAPYISMDDDFQLTFLSTLPEEADKPSPSLPDPSTVPPAVIMSRKR